eukprot:GHVP01012726.1.p1 GENE.GHVP01012726.1~~GHVP01012726.1.p1  ORF type:complete len:108 (-),score=5.58 GHVP01012726.1:389-712(-)
MILEKTTQSCPFFLPSFLPSFYMSKNIKRAKNVTSSRLKSTTDRSTRRNETSTGILKHPFKRDPTGTPGRRSDRQPTVTPKLRAYVQSRSRRAASQSGAAPPFRIIQ